MKLGKAFPLVLAVLGAAPVFGLAAACSDATDLEPVGPDGSTDGASGDAKVDGRADGGRPPNKDGGNCSAVKGACDLVLQDCPDDDKGQKQECVVTGSVGSLTASCVPVQPSQQLPIGRACCPSANNPCLPGLVCVGDECADGGPTTGRCAPPCCKGDDQACGKSDPEGIAGACDIALFIGDAEAHNICSYRERCKPFGQEPCGAGKACIIEDKVGTAGCLNSFGKELGQPCDFGNDCADGLFCLNLQGEDGGRCRMQCLTPGSNHPFDASVEEGGPRQGGCDPGEKCDLGPFQDLPPWLSFCRIGGQ